METVSIRDAKSQLSRLIKRTAAGECFLIVEAGKPMAKLVPFDVIDRLGVSRIGFMSGQITVPDDFDDMGRSEIAALFAHKA